MEYTEALEVAAACLSEFPPTNPRVLSNANAVLQSAGDRERALTVAEWLGIVGHDQESPAVRFGPGKPSHRPTAGAK
jgi:hypothetical protein